MKHRRILIGCAAAPLFAAAAAFAPALAADVRIGVALTYSGVGAELGTQIDRGLELFIQENPDAFGGHTVQLVRHDLKHAGGAGVRQAIEELVTKQRVDLLTGFVFSSNAIAAAPVATQARVPMVVMNASAASITNLSPYIARVSFTTWQAGYALGRYAQERLGCRTGAVGYSDYAAGRDARDAFRAGYEAADGQFLEAVPMGRESEVPDFSPYFEEVKKAGPECLYVFVPAGKHTQALIEAWVATGTKDLGVRLIGPGGLTQDNRLNDKGEEMVGLITMNHYSADYDTPVNRAFVAAWKRDYGEDTSPDFMGVGGWDGMAAIAHAIREQDGDITAEGTMEALSGWTYTSPRGPIMIDPETRDIIHDQHVHEVVRREGRLAIRVLDTIPQVRDPCKALKLGQCR